MAGFNYAQNIIGLDKVKGDIHELEVDVASLSASVLTISGDVDELELSVADLSASVLAIGGEVDELELSISELSASVLSIGGNVQEIEETVNNIKPKVRDGNITSDEIMSTLPLGTTLFAYMQYDGAPFTSQWVTVRTFGNSAIINQEIVCSSGYAFRHWESNTWGAWKKVLFS